jgi:vitamin K-dependent gamma-carboxylase
MDQNSFAQRLSTYLTQGADGHVLGLFRVLYSLLMVYEMVDYLRIDLVRNMFVLPKVNFKYDGLEWLRPLPEPIMDGLIWVLLGATVLMTLGVWFRWAARFFAVGYAYIFLIDKSIYNNHIYLFILLALLLSFTHADHFFSLRKNRVSQVQRWEPFIIQFQLMIVYVYAALVKFKYDWMLRQEPVRSMCKSIGPDHWMHSFVNNEFFVYWATYGGFLLDLLTPLLLWYKPARKIGLPLLVVFHLSNSQLFNDIGIFPFVMLAALIIFFDTQEVPLLRNWANRKPVGAAATPTWQWSDRALRWGLGAYFVFQLLFPLRGFFLPNDLDWTTIGNRFSWRVKADTRYPEVMQFSIVNPTNPSQQLPVDIQTFVNDYQMKALVADPRCVVELARAIKADVAKQGYSGAQVRADIRLRYNGQPTRHFVRPEVDLTAVKVSPFERLTWVNQ